MDWKSKKQKQTAKAILQILSQLRANKTAINNYLKQIDEEIEDIQIYEDQSKIHETLEMMINNDQFPVVKSPDGHFFERKDTEVVG